MVKKTSFYMFGMDGQRPQECAELLKERGIDAVVAPPDEQAAQAALQAGLDVWGCIGAFSLQADDPQEYYAEDALGRRGEWFGSGCPNEDALWQRNLAKIGRWRELGARGVFVDGARFASPCPGTEPFLSCFCKRCMAQGERAGYDMEKMRRDVRAWAQKPGTDAPRDWLRFRSECIGRRMAQFTGTVHNSAMQSGAFVFAPSLAPLVGQTEEALAGLDIVAPMLYRRYRQRPGIACLNAEYESLWHFYENRGESDISRAVFAQTGVLPQKTGAQEIWLSGFLPDAVGEETSRAAKQTKGVLAPIVQLDDDRLADTIGCAVQAGAQAVGFFAYTKEDIAKMPRLS